MKRIGILAEGFAEWQGGVDFLRLIGYSLRLGLGSYCAGKTLAELHVGSLTGTAILVILRDDGEALIPTGKDILRVGDLLALAGLPEAVEAARRLLVSGPENSR